jgi:hypothetical protein
MAFFELSGFSCILNPWDLKITGKLWGFRFGPHQKFATHHCWE